MLRQWDPLPMTSLEHVERRYVARRVILKEILPEDLEAEYHFVRPRKRGLLPWVPVQHKIEKLEDLRTMKNLQEDWSCRSTELVYRTIFVGGLIRVEVCGRRWYMAAPETALRFPLTVPAGCMK